MGLQYLSRIKRVPCYSFCSMLLRDYLQLKFYYIDYVFVLDKGSPVLLPLFNYTLGLFVVNIFLLSYCGDGLLLVIEAHIILWCDLNKEGLVLPSLPKNDQNQDINYFLSIIPFFIKPCKTLSLVTDLLVISRIQLIKSIRAFFLFRFKLMFFLH